MDDESLIISDYTQDQIKYISADEIWTDEGDHYEQWLRAGDYDDFRSLGKKIPKFKPKT